MRYYPAVIEKSREPGFGVSFPDLPGCVSAGDTMEEAVKNAEEALALHLEGMAAEGLAIPAPSNFDEIVEDADVERAALVLIPAKESEKVERINITMTRSQLERIDAAAKSRGLTRSAFLAEGAKRLMGSYSVSLRKPKAKSRKKETRRRA